MADLNRLVSENLGLAYGLLALLVLLLAVVVITQSVRLGRALRVYRELVRGASAGSVQDILRDHVGEVARVGERLAQLDRLQAELDVRSRGSVQHVGVVRFNPFEDTGSDQSFAIALLDGHRDGIVISSLHGRSNTRVFAKPVHGGASSHHLSDEEEQAIRIALEGTSRAAESP